MPREYTLKLLEIVDDGLVDNKTLIRDLLNWMSEDEVEAFYNVHQFGEHDEDEDCA